MKLPTLLDASQFLTENQNPPLLPWEISDIHQVLTLTDPLGQEEQPGCEYVGLGKNSLNLKDQGTLKMGLKLMMALHTLLHWWGYPPSTSLRWSKVFKVIKTKDSRAIKLNVVQKKSGVIKAPFDQARKNKHKVSELISGAPMANIKPACSWENWQIAANDRILANTAKHSNSKTLKAAPSRISNTKSHGQEKNQKNKNKTKDKQTNEKLQESWRE